MNCFALLAAVATGTTALIVLTILALAVYGAHTLCQQAHGRAQRRGDRRNRQAAAAAVARAVAARARTDHQAEQRLLAAMAAETQAAADLDACEALWNLPAHTAEEETP